MFMFPHVTAGMMLTKQAYLSHVPPLFSAFLSRESLCLCMASRAPVLLCIWRWSETEKLMETCMERVFYYFNSCLLLTFPCMKSCFHIVRFQNWSCKTSASHQTSCTFICFLAPALAFILPSATLLGSLTSLMVCGVINGVYLNGNNVCIYDHPPWLTQVTRCWRCWGCCFYFYTNAWNRLTGEKHCTFVICKEESPQLQPSSWSHEMTCERHLFTVMDPHSCDYASHFFQFFIPVSFSI